MVTFPNCKINLGLNIIEKRTDGFHNLETVFFPVNIRDGLEIIKEQKPESREISFSGSGLVVDGNNEDNICVKAYQILKKDFPTITSIQMHLHKVIPMGAGLGGGSADGAFVLKMLNELFNLNISQQQLVEYALQLGSDCPFFILNEPCFATSRGEKMERIELDLSSYKFIIVNSGIHINTGWAFKQIIPSVPKKSINTIINQPITSWKSELTNDFETPVFQSYPQIGDIKDELYKQGAIYASMSGSGSTVFGIFNKSKTCSNVFPPNYLFYEVV